MQLTEEQLFAMYGKAIAESIVLRGQLNQLGAELQAANSRVEQLEGILGQTEKKPGPRKPKAEAKAD